MFKRETRFRGQKRVAVGRSSRLTENLESRSKDSSHVESCDNNMTLQEAMRPEITFGTGAIDPTVPSIQMNLEEPDHTESVVNIYHLPVKGSYQIGEKS